MAARNLCWPMLPVPAGVRWVDKSYLGPMHEGAGAVAVLFAPPSDWIKSWPEPPLPTAVELIHVDSEGRAVLDRPVVDGGRPKRTHGVRRGSVAMFGNPLPSVSPGLNLAEGAADALALSARLPETTVAVGGVGGMGTDSLGDWLSGWLRVNLYADNDAKGLSVAGRLRRMMVAQNVAVGVFTLGSDYKDAADFAADNPFDSDVNLDAARDLAADLAAEGIPTWEAAQTRGPDRRCVPVEWGREHRMNVEDQRVELPPGPLDLVANAAERFSAAPDDLSAWLVLKAAVDAARPRRTDPLAKAVSVVLSQLEDGADPYALAAAYGDLDSRLNAVRPLDANSLSNPYPPEFEWLVYSWLPWGRVALLAGDGGLGKSRLALRLAAGIAAAEPDWLGGISTAEGSKRLDLRLDQPERVVIASWEDDLDEFDRRLAALRKHDATEGRVKFVDMADRGPLWAPLGNGHVASMASLTPAGEKLRGVHRGDRGRSAGHRSPGGRIRRGRELPRPRQGLPFQLGRLGAPVRLRGALRGPHPQERSANFRQHRLAKCGPKCLDAGIPGPPEARRVRPVPGTGGAGAGVREDKLRSASAVDLSVQEWGSDYRNRQAGVGGRAVRCLHQWQGEI